MEEASIRAQTVQVGSYYTDWFFQHNLALTTGQVGRFYNDEEKANRYRPKKSSSLSYLHLTYVTYQKNHVGYNPRCIESHKYILYIA